MSEKSPAALANDVSQATHYWEVGWPYRVFIPLTLADYAIERSLKPDIVLTHEPLSAQVLLGVWRN